MFYINSSGIISVNGAAGRNGLNTLSQTQHAGGGGGGGSGGGILIKLDSSKATLTLAGTLNANGGNGGNGGNALASLVNTNFGGGGGGGGGGGRIKVFFNGTLFDKSTKTVTPGTGGAAGKGSTAKNDGRAGVTGKSGTIYCVPEFHILAIPISLTLLVMFCLRHKHSNRRRKNRGKADGNEQTSSKGVVM
jgi:hypothetical protein